MDHSDFFAIVVGLSALCHLWSYYYG